MSNNLGVRSAIGATSTSNRVTSGAWVVTFRPDKLAANEPEFEVWHGAIRGPGGYFLVYIDDQMYGVGENGLINEYAPPAAMWVRKGQEITFHWSISTGTAPQVWLYLRRPEVGRL